MLYKNMGVRKKIENLKISAGSLEKFSMVQLIVQYDEQLIILFHKEMVHKKISIWYVVF